MSEITQYLSKVYEVTPVDQPSETVFTNTYLGRNVHCSSTFNRSILKNSDAIILTHHGKFHMDELFATAILISGPLYDTPDVYVLRSRDPELHQYSKYLLDIGREYDPLNDKFDHHQPNFNIQYNDTTLYATSGLVWMKYGVEVITKTLSNLVPMGLSNRRELIDFIYAEVEGYVKCIDNIDNAQKVETVTKLVPPANSWLSALNPVRTFSPDIAAEYNHGYVMALSNIILWLRNKILRVCTMWLGLEYLNEVESLSLKEPYIVLPYDLPWKELIGRKWAFLSKFKYMIIANRDNNVWVIHAIPVSPYNLYRVRIEFPNTLRCARPSTIQEITGISDIITISRNGATAIARTQISAKHLVEYMLNTYG